MEELYEKLMKNELPNHVAIIMDGNGRWAKKRWLTRSEGHRRGMEKVKEIIKATEELNIKYLTLYAFSTENWKRPKHEVNMLMKLLIEFFKKEIRELNEKGVKIKILGSLKNIADEVKKEILKAVEITKDNSNLFLNIAFNYGGRQEIVNAIKLLNKDIEDEKIEINDVTEENFKEYLYTKNDPDPDVIIRTSGEKRISNFLLYQMAYSEFIFIDKDWPEYSKKDFYDTILEYQGRKRNYGGI